MDVGCLAHDGAKLPGHIGKGPLAVEHAQRGRGLVAGEHSLEPAAFGKGLCRAVLGKGNGRAGNVDAHDRAHEEGGLLVALFCGVQGKDGRGRCGHAGQGAHARKEASSVQLGRALRHGAAPLWLPGPAG